MPEIIATPMLRFWRERLALSQADLAERAGVSPSTISRLERGGRAQATLVQRLTQALVEARVAFAEEIDSEPDDEPIDLTRPLSDQQRAWLDEQQRGKAPGAAL
jgi:transcriptional regulator with XRE-family HTH domain